MPRRILVTGASIAGNTVAWWLARSAFDVTVVERAPEFRRGGQNVDVTGLARRVVDLMGLRAEIARNGTGETGMAFVGTDNTAYAQFGVGEGVTQELEILRDDLARLIYEPTRGLAEYRFGDAIAAVAQDGDGALVTFESGRQERFDAVIVAEGVGSSTRELLFPGENKPRWLDMTIGYFTIPKAQTDSLCARWFCGKGGISIMLRPDRQGSCRALVMVQTKPGRTENLSIDEQMAFFERHLGGAGWETRRVLDGMAQSTDFYFGELRQARLDRWFNGRVALTGDAAWCPTPLSGVGASLAIIGGYVLAGEMSKGASLADAFAGYERVMRPIVAKNGPVPKVIPRMMHPRTEIGLRIHHAVISAFASPPAKWIVAKLSGGRAASDVLPEYEMVPRPGDPNVFRTADAETAQAFAKTTVIPSRETPISAPTPET